MAAVNALLIQSSGPLFVALWSLALFGVRLTWAQLAGIAISLLGVLTIILRGDFSALAGIQFNKGDVIFTVAGWLLFGPRPRIEGRELKWVLVWPIVWLIWTLVVGGLSGWYPYPFLDHREEHGVPGVVISIVGITAFFVAVLWVARLIDQRIQPAPQAWDPYRGGTART